MNIHKINLSIYNCCVIICVDFKIEEIIRWAIENGFEKEKFSNEWIKNFNHDIESSLGFVDSLGDCDKTLNHIIWLKEMPTINPLNIGVILHELYHVVDNIAHAIDRNHGLYSAEKTSEARAYLYEYLAIESLKIFRL